jgi:hypothetical protein
MVRRSTPLRRRGFSLGEEVTATFGATRKSTRAPNADRCPRLAVLGGGERDRSTPTPWKNMGKEKFLTAGLDRETRRWTALPMRLPHADISGLDVAGKALRIEQRTGAAVAHKLGFE